MRLSFYIFLLPLSLFAIYVGNPANPAVMTSGIFSRGYLIKGTSGYIYDYTSNKTYHATQENADFNPNSTFKQFGAHSQMGSFSVILIERIELSGALGGSKEQTKGKTHPSTTFDFESSYQFSWSSAAKVVLLQWGAVALGADFSYFAIPASSKSFFRYFDRIGLPITYGKQKVSLDEWQISTGLSAKLSFFAPYIGGSYLQSKLHVASTPETGPIHYKNETPWGYFFGVTVSINGRFHINLERRQNNESGYTLSTMAVF
jgi:hypothetical protein